VTRAKGGRARYFWAADRGGRYGERRRTSGALPKFWRVSTPTVAHLASHIEGSAHRDEDTKYDRDECRERDGLQKHAEAGGGEEPLRQRSLDEEIPMRAYVASSAYMPTCTCGGN
jgi:hypothetical protein